MRIGFDLHGVLDADPIAWTLHANLMKESGHEIYIISGPPLDQIAEELEQLDVALRTRDIHQISLPKFDGIFSIVNWLRENEIKIWEKVPGSDHWWANDEDWNSTKGKIAAQIGLDILYDDTFTYSEHMPEHTKFVLIKREKKR
jgi:hypothetical protein